MAGPQVPPVACPPGTSAIERAGLWSRISFNWVGPLIHKGWHNLKFEQDEARFLMPAHDDAPQLSQRFEQTMSQLKVGCGLGCQGGQLL